MTGFTLPFARLGLLLTIAALAAAYSFGEERGNIFFHLLHIHDLPAAAVMTALLTLLVAAHSRLPDPRPAVLWFARHRNAIATLLWVSLCASALLVYRDHPLSMDEYSARFQAQVFAAGHLAGQWPPDLIDALLPKGFQGQFLVVNHRTGAVASSYWPGFSLILSPFVVLGIPWACNPTLTAAALLLLARLARDLSGSEEARGWALVAALASAGFTLNGITYYSMPAHLFVNLLYTWLLIHPSAWRLLAAGLAGSLALCLHNPFPHAVFALPWIVMLLLQPRPWRSLSLLAAGYLPLTVLLLVGWPLFLQALSRVGSDAAMTAIASAATDGAGKSLGVFAAAARHFVLPDENVAIARAAGLAKLWLWSAPLLMIAAWQGAKGSVHPAARPLAASAVLTFFAYLVVPFNQGHGWGYRYFHPAFFALPVLAAHFLASETLTSAGSNRLRLWGGAFLIGLVVMTPLRLNQMGSFVAGHLAQTPPRLNEDRTLRLWSPRSSYYGLDLIQNDPWLRGRNIILLTAGSEQDNTLLRTHFPSATIAARNEYGITYRLQQ
ncbi:MAG: hypothetical protein EG825_02500 [Rhodocyclaceae bacterium]|nr:hypothetical protein [Rhodocyclaceae bacterium]